WRVEMELPTPDESRAWLEDFTRRRPAILLEHFSHQLGLRMRTIDIEIEPPHTGTVRLTTMAITDDHARIRAFSHVPLTFTVEAKEGMEFVGWQGKDRSSAITIDP